MTATYAVLALARPTFDVAFAEATRARAFAALDAADIQIVGRRELLFDGAAVEQAMADIRAAGTVDLVLLMQVTFTDASMTLKVARQTSAPIALWGFPEPRVGGRLRLNALCGINLAAHALGRAGMAFRWLFADPGQAGIGDSLYSLAQARDLIPAPLVQPDTEANAEAERVLKALKGSKVGVIGRHPDGFDTCAYDGERLADLVGMQVEQMDMQVLFDRAKGTDPERVADELAGVRESLSGVDAVDQEQLDRSLRVYCALQDLQQEKGVSGMAVRCWPEMFTEYGCAACGPMAMMNQNQVPCACEADVYGSLSTLMLQELAGEPVWMADLVDLDPNSDTAVLWHCGLAPLTMCDPEFEPEATIHTNRKMPLLHQFPLKPGRVTIARVSQARGVTRLVLGGAEVLRAPMAFTGTSGTLRFDRASADVLSLIMDEGLEHHYALAYGDHRPAMQAIAAQLEIPVLELG